MSDQFPIPVEVRYFTDLRVADDKRNRAWLHAITSLCSVPTAVVEYPDGHIATLSLLQYQLVAVEPLGEIALPKPAAESTSDGIDA